MKLFTKLVSTIIVLILFVACTKNNAIVGQKGFDELASSSYKPIIEISVKDYGKMQFELNPSEAPITVENFLKIVRDGFYDELTFHRIVPGLLIQGGDPLADGTGGTGETIKGEFKSNGIENSIKHKRGAISMARWDGEPDSASSQFFIMQQDADFLDGEYAAFGNIISGIEVVDSICEEVPTENEYGFVDKVEQPVIEYIKVIE